MVARTHPLPVFSLVAFLLLFAGLSGSGCTDGTVPTIYRGTMTISPDVQTNDGTKSDVEVYVYLPFGSDTPVTGVSLEILSSRGNLDVIEGPNGPTDASGKAVAFISSNTIGTASLSVKMGGRELCEKVLGDKCSPALRADIEFVSFCEDPLKECNGECVDLQTDNRHCGHCGNACSAGTACVGGSCSCEDQDRDGVGAEHCGGTDCDDDDDTVYGGAPERCDQKDNDCDGDTDESPEADEWCARQEGDCCNGMETCENGACQPAAAPLDCDDDNLCTDDSCNPDACCSEEECCIHTPNTLICDDGEPCTYGDRCAGGVCVGTPYSCDDGDPCTDDNCDGQGGCSYPFNHEPCDDDEPCTHTDTCDGAGNCVGTAYSCDDLNVCTDDVCDGNGGCSYPFNNAPCNDGVACTSPTSTPDPNDNCVDGLCRGVPDHAYCDDGNLCTTDYCDLVDGCVHNPNTQPCDDGIACTVVDTCDGMGRCYGTAEDALCDDGNVCTEGNCILEVGCVFTAKEGQCNDGLNCTYPDTCIGTSCVGTNRVIIPVAEGGCDDANPCTIDSCLESTGNCDYTTKDCTYLNGPCKTGICNPSDGTCIANDIPDGSLCDLGGVPGVCQGGICVTDTECVVPEDCDPVVCMTALCVSLKCQYVDAIGASCNDGVDCTDDICIANGICQGTPNDAFCDDSNPATADTCDVVAGCQYSSNVNIDSLVYTSSACMTRGASGRSTVFVDLRDNGGNPIPGATVTYSVSGAAVSWVEGAVVESTALPGTYYRTLIAPDTGAGSTISVSMVSGPVSENLNQTVTVAYADPQSGSGGTGGCSPADGNLRVKVIAAETGAPIANANVMIGHSQGTPFVTSVEDYLAGSAPSAGNLATTDADGYAYFRDLGTALDGDMTVTAGQPNGAAADRAYFTFEKVQASDLVVPLRLSVPQVSNVRFSSAGASDYEITGGINDLQGGLVLKEMTLDDLTILATEDLLATNHCLALPAGMGDFAIPENLYVPPQEVLMSGVYLDEAPWELSFRACSRLNMVFGAIDAGEVLSLCELGDILAAFKLAPFSSFRGTIGFGPSTDTCTDTSGYSIGMQALYPQTLTISTVNRPAWTDLLGLAMGDYEGTDGSGISYVNGMKLIKYTNADPNTAVVPYAADDVNGDNVPFDPDPAVARYYGAAVAMSFDPITARPLAERPDPSQGEGVSTVLWRDNGSGGAPFDGTASAVWTVDSFLEIAKVKIGPSNKYFVWDDVAANGTTPQLTVHEMTRVTQQYRDSPLACESEEDVIGTSKDVFWEVWRPYDVSCSDTTGSESVPNPKECFTLPTLPAAWPRAGYDVATGQEDGFGDRAGSGSPCVLEADCTITGDTCYLFGNRCDLARHRHCSNDGDCDDCLSGDVCTQVYQVCISDLGTIQKNVWFVRVAGLGMTGSFNFNRFNLADRFDYLTHESTNRMEFNQ